MISNLLINGKAIYLFCCLKIHRNCLDVRAQLHLTIMILLVLLSVLQKPRKYIFRFPCQKRSTFTLLHIRTFHRLKINLKTEKLKKILVIWKQTLLKLPLLCCFFVIIIESIQEHFVNGHLTLAGIPFKVFSNIISSKQFKDRKL